MSTSLSIRLKKASKIYYEGDIISGVVVIDSPVDVKHDGVSLHMEGAVNLQLNSKNAGLFEFSNTVKPISLVSNSIELASMGKIPAGVTEIPFEMPLEARHPVSPTYPGLLETYHGVFINVMYVFRAQMRRPFLNKSLYATCQFFVQFHKKECPPVTPVRCEITPATVRAGGGGPGGGAGAGGAGGARRPMPEFAIYVELDTTVCSLDAPFTGKISVEHCRAPVKGIELQLVRVETCGTSDARTKDATEIQNIQVAEGDVWRSLPLPLHMVLPRLFVCPTTTTPYFRIEFELNIAVIFEDNYLVTENFPILLVR